MVSWFMFNAYSSMATLTFLSMIFFTRRVYEFMLPKHYRDNGWLPIRTVVLILWIMLITASTILQMALQVFQGFT